LGKRIKRQGEVCVDRYEVLCANCQANTYAPTIKEAIEAWNQMVEDYWRYRADRFHEDDLPEE
jgi:predicted DNA-binding protein